MGSPDASLAPAQMEEGSKYLTGEGVAAEVGVAGEGRTAGSCYKVA